MNKSFKLAMLPAALSALALFSVAPRASADDIVDTAVKAGQFTTLVKLVTAAGLVDTLKGTGPFTVFAPTDAAFAKVPKKTLAMLANPANKSKLIAVLTYHVLSGKVEAADVLKMKSPSMPASVEGAKLTVTHTKKGVFINKAKVVKPDVEADNGVIHVIDSVLIPSDLASK